MSSRNILRLKFREDVSLSVSGMRIDFCCAEGDFPIYDAPEDAASALQMLALNGATSDELRERLLEHGDVGGWLILKTWLERLAGLICLSVETDDARIATFIPLTSRTSPMVPQAVGALCVLSRFAYIRRIGSQMVLECPLGQARVVLEDPRALAVVYRLARPAELDDLATETQLCPPSVQLLVSLLIKAGAVTALEHPAVTPEDVNGALASWEFHDLLFHTRSRLGRRDFRYGGTYRHTGMIRPLQALRPDRGDGALPLPRPDLNHAMRVDPPFAAVLEQRRSIRQFGDRPISVEAMSEFLYRTVRTKQVIQPDAGSQELQFRAYPAGGAIHELEIYPVIARCDGLDAGIYRYDPAGHALVKVVERNERVDALLSMARRTLGQDCDLQVLLVITARFQRVQWKYESMAYALILKNVGVLYQTMYLAATAMGLAPCALGGGDSDLFAMAAGLDYYAETSVGEFVLGTRGTESVAIDATRSQESRELKC